MRGETCKKGKVANSKENKNRTGHDVVADDVDVVVSVRPRVLVPKADDVAELVDHYAQLVAVLADRDRLRAGRFLADERAAPVPMLKRETNVKSNDIHHPP